MNYLCCDGKGKKRQTCPEYNIPKGNPGDLPKETAICGDCHGPLKDCDGP